MQDECRKWVWQLSSRDRPSCICACVRAYSMKIVMRTKPAVCFLALGCELRYNTADRARARARAKARSRSYAAMYTVYDARLNTLSALTYTCRSIHVAIWS